MIEPKDQKKFEKLLGAIKALFPDTTTSVRITITADETKIASRYRYPDELKKRSVSMRNIKGEWIK